MLSIGEFEALKKKIKKNTTVKSLLTLIEKEYLVPNPPAHVNVAGDDLKAAIHRPQKNEPVDETHKREKELKYKIATEGRMSKVDSVMRKNV
jgi:CRISPR/Cas system CSM-associated protein Csm4 (group 5 of RAMP superfamily)